MRAQQLASASHRELYYALQVGLEIDISLHTYRVAYCTDLLALMYRVYDDKARGGESSTGAHLKMPRLTLYDLEPSSNQGRLWHQMWTSELLRRPPFQRSYDSVLVIRFDMAFWKPAKLGAEMQKLAIFLDSSGADSVYFSFPWVPSAIHSHAEAKKMLARNESAPEATTTTTLLRQWPVGQWDFLVLCPAYARHASGRRPYVNDELQFVPHLTLHIARVLSVFPEHWATDCLTLASLQVRFLEDQPADSNPAVCKNAIYYCTDRQLWQVLRMPAEENAVVEEPGWNLNVPPASSDVNLPFQPNYHLAFLHRPQTSHAYRPYETSHILPGQVPQSLQVVASKSLHHPQPLKWNTPPKAPQYNVLNPSQRSLTTHWGSSAYDPEGNNWHSVATSPRPFSRSASMASFAGSKRATSEYEVPWDMRSPPASPSLSYPLPPAASTPPMGSPMTSRRSSPVHRSKGFTNRPLGSSMSPMRSSRRSPFAHGV
eukprot:jgi/Chrpa1/8963/Chrysochromulina_OHIO_Genome00014132-RA